MKVSKLLGTIAFVTVVFAPQLFAQPGGKETKVMVRAIARDAKLIGKGVGGARITIKDVSSGQVLAQGMLQDGTGETALIIEKPRVRGEKIYDTPGASGFLAVLNLERPTVVEVTAEGPLGSPQATQRASKTLLLVPGEDVLGDGIVLEIHGFIVKTLAPQLDAKLAVGSPFEVRATVTMVCGCPTEPDGHWDSNKIRVVARLVREGKIETEVPMHYAGVQNTYTGNVPAAVPGRIELQILAMEPVNANFGLTRQDLTIIP
jgi:hypothetical protein